jgi:hypothetical protein
MKVVPSRIKRFKQHLVGGLGDTMKCARVPEVVSKDMRAYLKKNTRSALVLDDDEGIEGEDDAPLLSLLLRSQLLKKVENQ